MSATRTSNKRAAVNAYYKNIPRFKRPRTVQPARAPLATRGYTPNSTELKVADIAPGLLQVTDAGSITLLANPTLGSDFTNRIGRKIRLKSLYIRGFLAVERSLANPPSVGQTRSQMGRMIILFDTQPNGALPLITDILVTNSPVSHLNLNNRDRFKVLCDKVWVFDPYILSTTASSYGANQNGCIKPVKKYKRMDLEVIYNSTSGGTIADIASGALLMCWIGSNPPGGDDLNVNLSTRVRYSDQ